MFKKLTKFKTLLPLGAMIVIPIVATSMTVKYSNNNTSVIIFNKKAFNSHEDALKYFMNKQIKNISKQNVIGSIDDATIDNKFNILDKKRLPNYNPDKVSFAYKASNGQLTSNFNIARSSFARPQSRVAKYTYPGGGFFDDKEIAEKTASKASQNQVVAISDIQLPGHGDQHYYMNSSNKKDIQSLKKALLDSKLNGFSFSKSLGELDSLTPKELVEFSDEVKKRSDNNGWGLEFISYDKQSGENFLITNKKEENIKRNVPQLLSTSQLLLMNPLGATIKIQKLNLLVKPESLNAKITSLNTQKNIYKASQNQMEDIFSGMEHFLWNGYFSTQASKDYVVNHNFEYRKLHRFSTFRLNDSWGAHHVTHMIPDWNGNKLQGVKVRVKWKDALGTTWKTRYYSMMSEFKQLVRENIYDLRNQARYYENQVNDLEAKIKNIQTTIHSLHEDTALKKIITYKGKPVFELKKEEANQYLRLENVSNNSIKYWHQHKKENLTEVDKGQFKKFISTLKTSKSVDELRKKISFFKPKWFISRRDLNDKQITLLKVYAQYINALNKFINNKNISSYISQGKIKDLLLGLDDILVLDSSTHYKDNLIYNKNFNPSIWGEQLKDGIRDLKDIAGIEFDKKNFSPQVSKVWVYYDSFGEPVLIDNDGEYNNSIFDNPTLMKENVVKANKINIDKEHVFILTEDDETKKDKKILVKNEINNIYKFSYDYNDMYFKTFENLKAYLLNIVKTNSYLKSN